MTEASHVGDLMTRLALSHPHISFQFINNGQSKLHTSGNGKLKDVIYHIYGRDIAANLLKAEYDAKGLKVTGFLGKPIISRGNRNFENYYVNGRYVKSKIVTKAVEQVNKKYYGDEDTRRKMEVKQAIYDELEEKGSLEVEAVKEKVFKDSPQMQADLEEKLEKYNMEKEVVRPKSEATIKKFQKQHLTTDTGIEITIPMEEYKDPEKVEFITNPDGTISVLIKNIGHLSTR